MNTDVPTKELSLIDRLFEAGAHYGYGRSKRHPSVIPFMYGMKDRVELFDLEKTAAALEKALEVVRALAAEKKTLLFVSGKPEGESAVRDAATRLSMPFVAGRWIGGAITNFPEIKKRVARLLDLKARRESGDLEKYTKKERLLFDREIEKLEKNFGGLVPLNEQLPHALFVVDPRKEKGAVKEARDAGIPIIALASSDCDMTEATYPIPANDASRKSILFFVNEIVRAYEEGLKTSD